MNVSKVFDAAVAIWVSSAVSSSSCEGWLVGATTSRKPPANPANVDDSVVTPDAIFPSKTSSIALLTLSFTVADVDVGGEGDEVKPLAVLDAPLPGDGAGGGGQLYMLFLDQCIPFKTSSLE